MTPERERELALSIAEAVEGGSPDSLPWPDQQEIYAWRVVRWNADAPVDALRRETLRQAAGEAMRPAGVAAACFSQAGDAMTILLCQTRFPAKAQRDMVSWLCVHALMESIILAKAGEGTVAVGEEFDNPADWQARLSSLREISDWWAEASPMDGAQAHAHRTHLQTIIKRRQYTALGGYVTRALRGTAEPGRMCLAFVPLVIEAVWSQHAELSLSSMTKELNLNELTRRPKETMMAWLASLQPQLKQGPTAISAAPIERVIAGIQADCSLPYSQQNLSRSLGLTPAYFCRLFHEKTGQHFSSFLTRTRMEKAKELLSDGRPRSLAEVSEACGYPNKSYFCQVFKKYTGMTPGEYEQRSKKPYE